MDLKKRWEAPQGFRYILRVGLPLVAGMASSTIMQFTDRLFLSHYSLSSISAALPAALASFTPQVAFMGFCGYSSVLIAQYVGSRALENVGPALWQGIWCALAGGAIMLFSCLFADAFFAWTGHQPDIQELESSYFIILSAGGVFPLLGAALGAFYSGLGHTRVVMLASLSAAVVNIPLDYALIFGVWGFPEMGIVGAGLSTVLGSAVAAAILVVHIFTRQNDELYCVSSSWRFNPAMFLRLLRYGLPSGLNMFLDLVIFSWFVFMVGGLGSVAMAASNIVFSINSLVFTPMLGLNMAVAALVGQAMGRGRPLEAERITANSIWLILAYIVPVAAIFVLFAGPLMDAFAPGNMRPEDFLPVREAGILLLCFVAAYSLTDSFNLVYFGALKGAGDTLAVMLIMLGCGIGVLALPILLLRAWGMEGLISFWIVLTVYIVVLAGCAFLRYKQRKWHGIRVVETAPPL